jgi:hypothetical protein
MRGGHEAWRAEAICLNRLYALWVTGVVEIDAGRSAQE